VSGHRLIQAIALAGESGGAARQAGANRPESAWTTHPRPASRNYSAIRRPFRSLRRPPASSGWRFK